MTTRELLKAANTTVGKLDRKLFAATWADLSDLERAAWLSYQTGRIRKAPKGWGAGRLVETSGGVPMAWWDMDTRIHGREKFPTWAA
jgi:hypothetical protein